MSFQFRRAKRENVSMLIGLMGGSGSGKTFSALRLATGICGDEPFAMIDTEAGRAKHYADQFRFDHGDLTPPFRPERYVEAIQAADKEGYRAIVVDSMSHVWAGEGGVLDWHEQELDRMAGHDFGKRERMKMAAWIKPKTSHKAMVQKLLQVRAHLILCFRAEEKVEMTKDSQGKTQIVQKQSPIGKDGWLPICDKQLPFELTASFLMLATQPGIPVPIKLQEQHRTFFPDNQPVSEDAGKRLGEWANGGAPAPTQPAQGQPGTQQAGQPSAPASGAENAPQRITQDRYDELVSAGWNTAYQGMEAVKQWWSQLSRAEQAELKDVKEDWKAKAAEVDQNAQAGAET
jgi:hypothetical protein